MKLLIEKMKKEKSEIYLKISKIIIVVLVLVIACFFMRATWLKNREIKELKSKIAEMENAQMKVDSIREEVMEISKYSAYEVNYTSIIRHADSNTFQGFKIPLTGNYFIATIDGKMNIGIDGEAVDISETKNSEGIITQVMLTIPHSEIQDNNTIQDSLEIYDEKNNIFNPVKVTDYNELIIEAEEKEKKKVLESDILQRADEKISYLLTSYLQKVYGENVEIKYEYSDSIKSSLSVND